MRIVRLVLWTVLGVIGSVWLLFPPAASACIAVDDGTRCENGRIHLVRVKPPAPVIAPVALTAPVPKPVALSGDSPANALPALDKWLSLTPGASAWLRMDDGKRSEIMNVWLDANGQEGISMAIYAPDVSAGLSADTKPTGMATHNKFEPDHDLRWRGQSPNGGTWYALVGNHTSAPISYKVGFVRNYVERECTGPYWEFLPNGAYVLWPGHCK